MAELPRAHVSHVATGRLRVKISEKRHDEAFFAGVAERLLQWDSVERVEVNPLTASVLVFFEDLTALFTENALKNDFFSVDFDELAAVAGAGFGFDGQRLAGRATQAAAAADAAVRRFSLGAADLRSSLFLALLAAGTYQLLRGNVGVPALALFWYAGEIVRLRDRILPAVSGDTVAEG